MVAKAEHEYPRPGSLIFCSFKGISWQERSLQPVGLIDRRMSTRLEIKLALPRAISGLDKHNLGHLNIEVPSSSKDLTHDGLLTRSVDVVGGLPLLVGPIKQLTVLGVPEQDLHDALGPGPHGYV